MTAVLGLSVMSATCMPAACLPAGDPSHPCSLVWCDYHRKAAAAAIGAAAGAQSKHTTASPK